MSEIVVDQFGKVEIPSHLRARLGWLPGRRLIVEADKEGSLKLRPVTEESHSAERAEEEVRLVYEGSVLVAQTEALEDITEFISRAREARLAALMDGITE